jgi:hypothetical protein
MSDKFKKDTSATSSVINAKSNKIHSNSQVKQEPPKKKAIREQLNEAKQKFKEGAIKVIWGNHMDNFNTVRSTSFFISFFWMQVVRLILLISLICIFGIYFYVYVRSIMFYYNCMALFFTTLAFLFLLIGSGK